MEYEVAATNLEGLDAFTTGYLECAEWCGLTDEDQVEAFRESHEPKWSEAALQQAREDCDGFRKYVQETGCSFEGWSDSEAGHDFWLTRNGHGAGYWDRGRAMGYNLTQAAKTFGSVDVEYNPEKEELSFL